MGTHSSVLVWRVPWTEEPGGLYSPRGRKESDPTERPTLPLPCVCACVRACVRAKSRQSCHFKSLQGFPGGSAGKESARNVGDLGLIPRLGRSPGEGNGWLPTPVFWPGEFHELYRPRGHKESDTIEQLSLTSLSNCYGI